MDAGSFALPAIQNAAAPFTRPVEAWVGAKSGAGAAEGTANEKQREEERAAANQPPGVIPEAPCGPAGEYCEGPGEGPGQTIEEYFNGNTGGEASAAGANPCKLGLVFGEVSAQELFAGGWFSCNKDMRAFKIQTCILWEKLNTGTWTNLECSHEGAKGGQVFTGQSGGKNWVDSEFCEIGLHYYGWVWGEILGAGGYQLKPIKAASITCTGKGSEEFYEQVEDFLKDGEGALP